MLWPGSTGAWLTSADARTHMHCDVTRKPTVSGNLLTASPPAGATWRATSSHRPLGSANATNAASDVFVGNATSSSDRPAHKAVAGATPAPCAPSHGAITHLRRLTWWRDAAHAPSGECGFEGT